MKSYIFLLLPFLLHGASLESLIEEATTSHTTLKAIEQKLSAVTDEYHLSKNFVNPELSLSISDIQFTEPLKRSLEPMQFTSINIKQKIPYFGKIDAKGAQIKAKEKRISFSLMDAKVKLTEMIKINAYSIWQVEEELQIISAYIKLTHQTIELFTAYNNSDNNSHMGIMSAELSLSQLKIKQSNLEGLLTGVYQRISYLSESEVTSIELNADITPPKDIDYYLVFIDKNSKYKLKVSRVKELEANTKVQELSKYLDPVVQVGYYRRENFNDYINIGIGFSLPIYGSEDSKVQSSRKLALSQKSEASDYKNLLASRVHSLYAKLLDAYNVYTIIQEDSLPQVQHMFDLSSSAIKNGAELFIYIDMLEKKLQLEKQSINAQARYHKTLASLDALIGEIK